jgi:hypothetical protein
MTTFPGSPRLLKGALVGVEPVNPIASIIVFQYNPATMTRRLEARSTGSGGGDQAEVYRLTGPPKETITIKVEIDVADQLEQGSPLAVANGIYPALSALEMLLYPSSERIIGNAITAAIGGIEIIPPEAPLTLFVWGPKRVLPVRLTSFSVTEQAYDPALNPIRAEVDLSLEVLTTSDFQVTHPGYNIYLIHQIAKEAMAMTHVATSAENLGTSLPIP